MNIIQRICGALLLILAAKTIGAIVDGDSAKNKIQEKNVVVVKAEGTVK